MQRLNGELQWTTHSFLEVIVRPVGVHGEQADGQGLRTSDAMRGRVLQVHSTMLILVLVRPHLRSIRDPRYPQGNGLTRPL